MRAGCRAHPHAQAFSATAAPPTRPRCPTSHTNSTRVRQQQHTHWPPCPPCPALTAVRLSALAEGERAPLARACAPRDAAQAGGSAGVRCAAVLRGARIAGRCGRGRRLQRGRAHSRARLDGCVPCRLLARVLGARPACGLVCALLRALCPQCLRPVTADSPAADPTLHVQAATRTRARTRPSAKPGGRTLRS